VGDVGEIDCEEVMSCFVIEIFTSVQKGALVEFATVGMPIGLVFHDVTVCRKNASVWASPSKAMISKDSTVMREVRNKIRYMPVVSFRDKATRNRWSDAVIAALKEQRPEMLA
jgi:hypothetical protein